MNTDKQTDEQMDLKHKLLVEVITVWCALGAKLLRGASNLK